MIRITADLDNTRLSVARVRTTAVIAWLYHHYTIIFDKRIIRKSPSGKGYHIILWTSQRMTNKEIFFTRALLGDDPKRLELDMKRRRPKQYLFNKKIPAKNDKKSIKQREALR